MNNRFLIVLVVAWQLTLALCTRAGSTQPTSFTYNGFSKATSIQFNGSATNVTTSDGPVLQLTPASASKAGSAFTSNSVTLAPNAGFSTFFTFRLSQPGGPTPAGGITFTIQSASPFILGSAGSGHGYGGISNSLTVVFATSTNGTLAGNHVAVNINGQLNEPVSASVTNAALNDGNIWYAWIDYDGVHGLLEVRLAQGPVRPPAVTLAAVVNLPGILGGTNVVATGNLLTNGDFESEPNWGGGVSYDGGETALVGSELPGWTIEPGHAVTIHNSPGPYLVISNTYSVNTDGEGYNGHNANFYQDFDSTTLASYALTFNWQSWGQYGTPTTSKLMVSVTDTVTSAVLFTGLYSYDGSAPHPVHLVTANFPGTGHPLRLRVEESPESGYNDNTYMVDNFSVTAGSPPLGAYVGFTGGTGAGWNQQDILSWKFMALPTARFIGHYALTNISPNFRLTNGFAFKSYFYQVNGVTYTNIYAYRENFTQEPDGSVDFVTDPESSPIVDTSHGPDTTDGGGDQVEWMQMLSEYDDTVSGTPTSGIIAPLSVPVPTGQTFEQSFNGISEAFAQSQLEALDPSLLQLPAPPTDANQALALAISAVDQLNNFLQETETTLKQVLGNLSGGGGAGGSGGGGSGGGGDINVDNELNAISSYLNGVQQIQIEMINNLASYSVAVNLGTVTAREQLISGPPLPLQLLAPRIIGTNFSCHFLTVSNQNYTVWSNTNLTTATWINYTNVLGDGYVQEIIVPSTLGAKSFYRLSSP